jgi:hypothetical protein
VQPVTTDLPRNLVPGRYRGVSVARVELSHDEGTFRDYFLGRKAYFKTRFIVVHSDDATALLQVAKADDRELFSPITEVRLLATDDETAYVNAPEVDTGIPSELARVARECAPSARAVVVRGRYEHVNFIVGPDPLRITVREVVPPRPAKLFDQAQRVLQIREDLPPIELVADVIDLADVAQQHPAASYLLPCRGSGFAVAGAQMSYLDEHPVHQDWTLLGCVRSQQIHREFFGVDANAVTICPLIRESIDGPLLTKCCLQDDENLSSDGSVSVPWGASLQRVSEALDQLVRMGEPSWQPA